MKRHSVRHLVAAACVLVGLGVVRAAAQDTSGQCSEVEPGLQLTEVVVEQDMLDDSGKPITSATVKRLCFPNLKAADILSRLDIDGDGVADNSPDTDGDGLPDNWELGGVETVDTDGDGLADDRVVFFPAPTAVVPGTPPTPIFTRRAVATSAFDGDTDGDGISDFDEVFGLMFIDDNRDGVLDANEWIDFNNDGLPSPGEWPVDQSGTADYTKTELLHDFDGFVFVDPTNPDTDGDGVSDGADKDPLINPRSFGLSEEFIIRFNANDPDIDKDGLGNGMDMGNDLLPAEAPGLTQSRVIDNPANVRELLDLFRADLLGEGVVPESTIEDLIGADWDGNGLWRTTDVREWSPVIDDPDQEGTQPDRTLFRLDPNDSGTNLYTLQTFAALQRVFNDLDFARYGGRRIGLGIQEVLKPSSTDAFVPDVRIWAILYSWRMAGFDIDGDGFVGVPNLSNTVALNGRRAVALVLDTRSGSFQLTDSVSAEKRDDATTKPFDDRITIGQPETTEPQLNGVIEAPGVTTALRRFGCGAINLGMLPALMLGLTCTRFRRRHP